jgi:hypothetical protein
MVVNTSKDKPIDAIINLPDVHNSIFGLFDGKKIECTGKLKVSLKPYDTKAYKIK